MNRYLIYLIIFGALLAAVIVAIGVFIYLSPSRSISPTQQTTPPVTTAPGTPTPVGTTPPSATQTEAIQLAFKSGIAPYVTDNLKLHETVIAGDYALQLWSSDSMGGEALLKYDSGQGLWLFITANGGTWSVDGLVVAGVPRETATILLVNVPHY